MAQSHAAATAASVMASNWILSGAFTDYTNTLVGPKLQRPAFRMSDEAYRRSWPAPRWHSGSDAAYASSLNGSIISQPSLSRTTTFMPESLSVLANRVALFTASKSCATELFPLHPVDPV
jgi:hypothetical protein